MTTIGFVRHGITAWNVEKRAQGSANIPLHEEGIEGAKKIAERLAGEQWDIIYTSPQKRALQTAQIIGEKLPHALIVADERLREISGGQIEGTTEEERLEKWGADWRSLDLGIEKHEEILERGMSFMNEIKEKHPNDRVLVVSHGGIIRKLICSILNDYETYANLDNTSLSVLQFNETGANCSLFNCTKHLIPASS